METSSDIDVVDMVYFTRPLWNARIVLEFIREEVEMMFSYVKNGLKQNRQILDYLLQWYKVFLRYRYKIGKQNELHMGMSRIKRTKIKVLGENNQIIINNFTGIIDCEILITGNNNIVNIGERVNLNKSVICLRGDNNVFSMGNHTTTNCLIEFIAMDGTKIIIGEDCMISENIHFWTGDYHSIINANGERTNPSKDIVIGDHVWIGTQANIMKGVEIGNNSIIGAGALITKKFTEDKVLIAGNPAKIVKKDVNWLRESI